MAHTDWSDRAFVVQTRERWPLADTVVLAINRFRVHRTGRNSALVAHYGFLSIFPLLLVFTTILGFVLDGNVELQQRIIDSTIAQVPIIGDQLATDPTQLQGSVPLLVFGLLTATWSGLKAFNVLQTALDDVAEVPFDTRPSLVRVRLRSLLGIGLAGGSLVAGAVLSTLAGMTGLAWTSRILLGVGTLALNTLVLASVYRWLCSSRPPWSAVWPGAIFGGIGFTMLQVAGSTLMTRAIAHASPIYGTFATVIGLLFWLGLHAMISLLGAEMNGVLLVRRVRTPRQVRTTRRVRTR